MGVCANPDFHIQYLYKYTCKTNEENYIIYIYLKLCHDVYTKVPLCTFGLW